MIGGLGTAARYAILASLALGGLAALAIPSFAARSDIPKPPIIALSSPAKIAASKTKTKIKTKAIAMLLNGEQLALNPSPIVYKGRLFVPLRRIIEALGLDFQRSGSSVTTHIGYKTVTLQLNSQRADVNGMPVDLDAPPVEIKYVFYVPLRFFTNILDAQARFDSRSNIVSISAQFVGVTGNGIMVHGNQVEEVGTATAVDLNSDPPTITLTYNASVRTLQVLPNADISLEDVNASVTMPGELSNVHPGDFVHLFGDRHGGIHRVIDQFGTRSGNVEAITNSQMVLDSGDVIVPDKITTYSIDGKLVNVSGSPATLSDIHAGDRVTVRYNIYSGEVREILVVEGDQQPVGMRATPPGVGDFAPDNGEVVNNNQPAIYAAFVSDGSPVNPSSVILWVNGRDVTSGSVRTTRFIEYMPGMSYPDGPIHVTVRFSDTAGNTTTKSWAFKIKTR